MSIEIQEVLKQLSQRRPIFHSEADFQHGLAWQFQLTKSDLRVRLEVPITGFEGRAALDLVVRDAGITTAVELKYCKGALKVEHEGENFNLPPTLARDLFRYDVCKNIWRIERAIATGQADLGSVVVLTNDSALWTDTGSKSIDLDFKIHDGRRLSGCLKWGPGAGIGTTKGREDPITLAGEYMPSWLPYSNLGLKNGEFRVLVVPVSKVAAEPLAWESPPTDLVPAQPRGKYRKLQQYFADRDGDFEMTFAEIEALVGPLPPTAHIRNVWWYSYRSHPHAVWELEGYKATPHLFKKRVTFRKLGG